MLIPANRLLLRKRIQVLQTAEHQQIRVLLAIEYLREEQRRRDVKAQVIRRLLGEAEVKRRLVNAGRMTPAEVKRWARIRGIQILADMGEQDLISQLGL